MMRWKNLELVVCALLLFVEVSCLQGCKTCYRIVENEKVETRFNGIEKSDSVVLYDSIYIRAGADTVFVTHWHTRWRERVIRDSICLTDTLVKQIQVVREVKVKNRLNMAFVAISVVLLLILLGKTGVLKRVITICKTVFKQI